MVAEDDPHPRIQADIPDRNEPVGHIGQRADLRLRIGRVDLLADLVDKGEVAGGDLAAPALLLLGGIERAARLAFAEAAGVVAADGEDAAGILLEPVQHILGRQPDDLGMRGAGLAGVARGVLAAAFALEEAEILRMRVEQGVRHHGAEDVPAAGDHGGAFLVLRPLRRAEMGLHAVAGDPVPRVDRPSAAPRAGKGHFAPRERRFLAVVDRSDRQRRPLRTIFAFLARMEPAQANLLLEEGVGSKKHPRGIPGGDQQTVRVGMDQKSVRRERGGLVGQAREGLRCREPDRVASRDGLRGLLHVGPRRFPEIAGEFVGGMALDGRGIGGDENHGGGLPLPGQDPGAVVAGPPRQRQASGCQQAPRGAPHAPETMMAHF